MTRLLLPAKSIDYNDTFCRRYQQYFTATVSDTFCSSNLQSIYSHSSKFFLRLKYEYMSGIQCLTYYISIIFLSSHQSTNTTSLLHATFQCKECTSHMMCKSRSQSPPTNSKSKFCGLADSCWCWRVHCIA